MNGCERRARVFGGFLASAALACWVASALAAAPRTAGSAEQREQAEQALAPTVVTSDSMTYDYEKGVAVFEKNVHVDDPRIRLWSERLTIVMEGTNQVRSLLAEGSVRFAQADGRGSARRAEYHATAGKVVLTGDALLIQGSDEMRADAIEFEFADNAMRNVRASGRVRMTRSASGQLDGMPSLLPGLTKDREP